MCTHTSANYFGVFKFEKGSFVISINTFKCYFLIRWEINVNINIEVNKWKLLALTKSSFIVEKFWDVIKKEPNKIMLLHFY